MSLSVEAIEQKHVVDMPVVVPLRLNLRYTSFGIVPVLAYPFTYAKQNVLSRQHGILISVQGSFSHLVVRNRLLDNLLLPQL